LRQFANESPGTEELVLARCGKTPEGTMYTNPTRKKFFDCAGPIFDETALASAIRYMEVYGNSTPIPRPATPPTLPPPASPSPTRSFTCAGSSFPQCQCGVQCSRQSRSQWSRRSPRQRDYGRGVRLSLH